MLSSQETEVSFFFGYKECQKEQWLLIHINSIIVYGAIHKVSQANAKKMIQNSMEALKVQILPTRESWSICASYLQLTLF